MNAAHKVEREVVCNDDFDGNEDVLEAIEDIRQVATELRTLTGVDSKARMKRAEQERGITDVLRINNNNKEFQYCFAYTCYADDAIHVFGASDATFDANLGVEIVKRACRWVRNPEDLIHAIRFAILEDDEDD
jgi:hypothetical protein